MWNKIKPYVLGIGISLAVGGLSSLLTKDSMDVYEKINKPPLAPPGYLFPIVWTVLFILMGIGVGLVYVKGRENSKGALIAYAVQLAANFIWTLIFFNMEAYLFAFIWIILLLILILVMIYKFYEISPLAAVLQIPYFLWVSFATYLTFMIYMLN